MSEDKIDDLIEAVNSVAIAAEPSLSELVLYPIIAGVVGALAAYLFSMLQARISDEKESKSRLARELSHGVLELQNHSVSYWSKDYNRQKIDEAEINEAHIHAGLVLVQSLSTQFLDQKMKSSDREKYRIILNNFMSDAHEEITGGEFESGNRKASKSKVQSIISLCTNIRALLSDFC